MNIFRRLRDAVAIISMLVAVAADPLQAERSFWVHATLPSNSWARSYWETVPLPPPTHAATKREVRRAARLLAEKYHANTLYLLFHGEVDWVVAAPISRAWRAAAPPSVELVPTLLFRTYNSSEGIAPLGGSLNFNVTRSNATLDRMLKLFASINLRRLGVFDVYPNRDQGPGPALAQAQRMELTRIGLQPAEVLPPLFRAGGVIDTWSDVCCGRTNALWADLPCGAATLRLGLGPLC